MDVRRRIEIKAGKDSGREWANKTDQNTPSIGMKMPDWNPLLCKINMR